MKFRPPFAATHTYIHTPCNACNACNARVISGCNGYSGRNGWGRETCVTDGVAVAAPRRGFRACASHPQVCRRHLQGACATGASSLRSAPLVCFWLYTEALERGLLSYSSFEPASPTCESRIAIASSAIDPQASRSSRGQVLGNAAAYECWVAQQCGRLALMPVAAGRCGTCSVPAAHPGGRLLQHLLVGHAS